MTIIDPVDIMNRAHQIRQTATKAGEKLKPAYAGYVDLAREQLANAGRALTDDEIKGVMAKPETKGERRPARQAAARASARIARRSSARVRSSRTRLRPCSMLSIAVPSSTFTASTCP